MPVDANSDPISPDDMTFDLAPPGYIERLIEHLRKAPVLEDQSAFPDPPCEF